jgi:hypothetical protein
MDSGTGETAIAPVLHDATSGARLPQFGGKFSASNAIKAESGSAVNRLFQAEARHDCMLGSDFAYSATITADCTRPDLSAHHLPKGQPSESKSPESK